MPILGGLLIAIAASIAEFFALFMAKRTAVAVAGIAAFVLLLGVLATALTALVAGLAVGMPSDSFFMTGLYFGLPSNGAVCMAAWLAIDAACGAYRVGMVKVRFAVGA